jgi:hypothetical protein
MEDLLQWLRREKGGAATYAQFREKALALRHQEPEHAALLRLLAEIAGRFADAYDEERLPLELSKAVLAHLTSLVEKAVVIEAAGDPRRELALLNEIGFAELGS